MTRNARSLVATVALVATVGCSPGAAVESTGPASSSALPSGVPSATSATPERTQAAEPGASQIAEAERITAFNSMIAIGGATGGERYESLAAMTEDSDLVVRGNPVAVELGPSWVVDTATGQVAHRARVLFSVSEVMAGVPVEASANTIWLTFPVPGPEAVAALEAALPRHEAIVYLRNIGDYARRRGLPADHVLSDRRLYRLVGDDVGILWNDDGLVAPGPSPDEWVGGVIGTSFAELTANARAVVRR